MHLLALLLGFHAAAQVGGAFLGQQFFVEGLGVIVIARQQFVLLFDAWTHRGFALVDPNLALQPLLVQGGLLDDALILVNLQAELADFRRFGGARLLVAVGGGVGGSGGVDLFQPFFDFGDVSLGFDDVRVIVGIARLQLQQLPL